jgi:Zn-dependent alcohol dehydrogenases, class III
MCSSSRPALCDPATVAYAVAVLRDRTTRLSLKGKSIPPPSGVAGFAEYSVLSKEALVKIDKSIPFAPAALFGCGVVPGVGSVINTADAKAGQFIGFVGLGGVPLKAVLASLAFRAGPLWQ